MTICVVASWIVLSVAPAEESPRSLTRKSTRQIEEAVAQFRKERFQRRDRVNVVRAIPFRNPGDPAEYIALTATVDWYTVVYLLRETDRGYEIVWQSEDQKEALLQGGLIASDSLIQDELFVEDADQDGAGELFFVWYSSGGEGSLRGEHATLSLYVPQKGSLFSMHARRQTWPYPPYPLPQFSPNVLTPANRVYKSWLEAKGHELGLKESSSIDVHDPVYEIHLWFANHGPMKNGVVRLREYAGEATFWAPVAAEVIDGDTVWRAYENGPVFGYDRKLDLRYIVYAPEIMQRWANALAVDDRFLWIGTRGDGLLRYEKATKTLRQFLSIEGISPLPNEIASIVINEKHLVLNGTLRVPKEPLMK